METTPTLEPRHGSSHFANIGYGYGALAATALHAGALYLFQRLLRVAQKTSFWNLFLTSAAYIAAILGLCAYHIEFRHDYSTWVKRFGRLGYALLPFDIVLALRPGPLHYLNQIGLHKWISRIIVGAAVIHSVGFLYKWFLEATMLHKVFQWQNFLGVAVFAMALLLVVVSLKPLRRRRYLLFYVVHNATVWLMVFLIVLHARPGVNPIALLSGLILVYQAYMRFWRAHRVSNIVVVETEGGSGIQVVKIPKPEYLPDGTTGSHIRLTYTSTNWRSWVYPTHPYTVASMPTDPTLDLVIKKHANFGLSEVDYALTGPFQSLPNTFFDSAESVAVFCGGSGISLGIPVVRDLASKRVPVKLIWCTRDKSDLFVLRELKFRHPIEVYITGNANGGALFDEEAHGLLFDNGNFELQSLSSNEEANAAPQEPPKKETLPGVALHQGRPDLDSVFSDIKAAPATNRYIVACGPESLIHAAEKWGAEHKVTLLSEVYAM